jgi:hypothetical protein
MLISNWKGLNDIGLPCKKKILRSFVRPQLLKRLYLQELFTMGRIEIKGCYFQRCQ